VQVQTRHGPSFAVARLLLAGGEPARVESSAMLATSYGVAIEARAVGGCLTRGNWLASAAGVHLDTQWAGFGSLFGGADGFLLHYDLVAIDTGHVVGSAVPVQSRVRQASPGTTPQVSGTARSAQSMKTGAGLVFDFAGPGRVLTQTRSPRGLIGWLHANGLRSRA